MKTEKILNLVGMGKIILKKWYITVLIPLIIAAGSYKFFYQILSNSPEYTATTSFVVASATANLELVDDQHRMVKQELAEELVTTVSELVTNDKVLTSSIKELYGKNAFTAQQIQYIQLPKLKANIAVNNEVASMICTVTVTDAKATRAKNMANQLVKQTQHEAKTIWGLDMVTPLKEAITPLKSNSYKRMLVTCVAGTFMVAFLLISLLTVVINRRNL